MRFSSYQVSSCQVRFHSCVSVSIRGWFQIIKNMNWSKMKKVIVLGVCVLVANGMWAAPRTNAVEGGESLTLKVKPGVFIRNLLARADETMNVPSDGYSEILLDLLKMEGFDFGNGKAPRGIAFNVQTGEISTHNTPASLEVFRKIVADLNREDGSFLPPDASAPKRKEILLAGQFYKISGAQFKKLGLILGKPQSPGKKGDPRFGTTEESPAWILSAHLVQEARAYLKDSEVKPFTSPRIHTAQSVSASLFFGEASNNIRLKCLPLVFVDEKTVELKVEGSTTGKFNQKPEGDWPTFAGRTNCAFFARTLVELEGGVLFRAENKDGLPANNLLVLLEAKRP